MTETKPTKVFVTGAAGFLGQSVITCLTRAGHPVIANARRKASNSLAAHVKTTASRDIEADGSQSIQWVYNDLVSPRHLEQDLAGCGAVIHLAARLDGSPDSVAETVASTKNLISVMCKAGVDRLILVSSLAVYDYLKIPVGGVLDEGCEMQADDGSRDRYCRAKLTQERLVDNHFAASGLRQLTILRPGILYGPNRLTNSRIGVRLTKRLQLVFGGHAKLPLIHVENCAAAIVAAVNYPDSGRKVYNLVDDLLPTQLEYVDRLAKAHERSFTIAMPLSLASLSTRAAAVVAKCVGRSGPSNATFAARFRPLNYSNASAKCGLGWAPFGSFVDHISKY